MGKFSPSKFKSSSSFFKFNKHQTTSNQPSTKKTNFFPMEFKAQFGRFGNNERNDADVHQNIYHHQNYHQPYQNADFNPNNPLHANLWRFPRSGGVINVDPAELGRSREFWGNCCLGFLVDYRLFEDDLVNDMIRKKWSTDGKITVFRMGEIYVFHCESNTDLEGLLARSTVTLDGALMVLAKWYPDTIPRTVRFPYAELWVRVCGLPFECLNMHVAHVAGKLLSHHYNVEPFEILPRNDYLRLRVCLKLNEPLMPGFFLAMDAGHLLLVQFKYEEVFKYCIRCGKVGHKGSQCRENMMSVVSSVNHMLDRSVERGFVVFQANNNHTMFNLDLRATPSTTRYISSRLHLGDRLRASENPGRHSRERAVDFGLGTTPGGRVLPGMSFAVTAQPFAGPVVFNVGFGAVHLGGEGGVQQGGNGQQQGHENLQGQGQDVVMGEGGADVNGDQGIMNSGVDGIGVSGLNGTLREGGEGHGGVQGQTEGRRLGAGGWLVGEGSNANPEVYFSAGEDFEGSGEQNAGVPGLLQQVQVNDPYVVYAGPRHQRRTLDRDLRLQEAILNRVESDVEWVRVLDDDRGYNQTFNPPPEGIPITYHFPEVVLGENNVPVGGMLDPMVPDVAGNSPNNAIVVSSDSEEEFFEEEGQTDSYPSSWMIEPGDGRTPSNESSLFHHSSAIDLVTSSEHMEEVTGTEVNTDLCLNGITQPVDGGVEATAQGEETEVALTVIPAAIIRKDKELQAQLAAVKPLKEIWKDVKGGHISELDAGEGSALKKVKLFDVPSYGTPSAKLIALMDDGKKAASLSDGLMGLADCYHVPSVGGDYRDAVVAARKRKCCSETSEGLVPGEVVESIDSAKKYLSQLAKKRCLGGPAQAPVTVGAGGFRVAVTDMEIEVSTDSSQASNSGGFAEVGPNQPPGLS